MTRSMRELPLVQTGRPVPFRIGAPAYLAALGGWCAAAVLLLAAAADLARTSVAGDAAVGAAHAIGLVFFPFAVVAAVWQLLPVMLRCTLSPGRSSSPGSRSGRLLQR